jgi:hypothetical protein
MGLFRIELRNSYPNGECRVNQTNKANKNKHLEIREISEEAQLIDKILKNFREKSLQEQIQSFVDVGIYNEKGQLTQRYGVGWHPTKTSQPKPTQAICPSYRENLFPPKPSRTKA